MDGPRDEEAATASTPLLASSWRTGTRSHAADAHLLSAAFLFVFSAYGGAQNLQSSINTVRPSPPLSRIPVCSAPTTGSLSRALQDGDLGTVSLGILYTSFTLFSVVASPVVTRLGSERALVLGTSGYLLFILANLVPAWCVSLGCSSVSVSQNARENTDDVPRRAG
jgi:hypothetical protein